MPPQLEPVDIPYGVQYLWGFFCELSNSRDHSEAGPKPITWTEIKAWAELTKSDPSPWEIDVIKAIDRAFLKEGNKK